MSTMAIELALFPLKTVLFPGTVRPLHISEPRYQQMIKDCLCQDKPFGVVLRREESAYLNEESYAVGTIAEIHNLNCLENGSYNLMAVGIQRFRILDRYRDKPYLSALVEPFSDTPVPFRTMTLYVDRVRSLFISYLQMLLEAPGDKIVETDLPREAEDLSHFIAYFLDIEDEQKQPFLEMTSTVERLQEEIAFLRREVPFMREILFRGPPKERVVLN